MILFIKDPGHPDMAVILVSHNLAAEEKSVVLLVSVDRAGSQCQRQVGIFS